MATTPGALVSTRRVSAPSATFKSRRKARISLNCARYEPVSPSCISRGIYSAGFCTMPELEMGMSRALLIRATPFLEVKLWCAAARRSSQAGVTVPTRSWAGSIKRPGCMAKKKVNARCPLLISATCATVRSLALVMSRARAARPAPDTGKTPLSIKGMA